MSSEAVSRDDVYQKLTAIFRQLFDDDTLEIRDETTAKDIDQWDSLNHINLIVATEQKFGVRFKTAEVAGFANVGQLVDTLQAKLNK
jgi:acyl carrier protein